MTVVIVPDAQTLPEALMLPAEAVVRGKRDQLLDRMEELARWRVSAEGQALAMADRIKRWDLPTDGRSTYVYGYRKLSGHIGKADRISVTLNAELARRM